MPERILSFPLMTLKGRIVRMALTTRASQTRGSCGCLSELRIPITECGIEVVIEYSGSSLKEAVRHSEASSQWGYAAVKHPNLARECAFLAGYNPAE